MKEVRHKRLNLVWSHWHEMSRTGNFRGKKSVSSCKKTTGQGNEEWLLTGLFKRGDKNSKIKLWWWCLVTKLYPTLWDPMDYSTPGFPVLHYLPELAQTHVHWVGDAIQPPHPLLPSSPTALNLWWVFDSLKILKKVLIAYELCHDKAVFKNRVMQDKLVGPPRWC